MLTSQARAIVLDTDNHVSVSAASVWEIAIKHALGRSGLPFSAKAAVGYFQQASYRFLNIRPEHAAAVELLPMLHGDLFDRLLVAQVQIEPMRLLTHDRALAPYSDSIILV